MAYNYSLMDDDEDLTAPLLDQAADYARTLSMSTTGLNVPKGDPAAGAQVDSPWQPHASTRDPALDAQWQQAESQGLQRQQAYLNNEYGAGEFARDYGGLAVTGLIDAFANKGKGLPTLAGATLQANQVADARRQADAKSAGEFALKARAQKDSDLQNQIRIKQIQQQDERIGLAGQGEQRRTGVYDRGYNPNNQALVAAKQLLLQQAGGRVTPEQLAGLDEKGLADVRHGLNLDIDSANTTQKAADEATIATARSTASQNAVNQSNVNYAPALGVARGEGEAGAEKITRPGKVVTSAQTAEAGARGREVVEQPIRQERQSEEFKTKFAKDNEALLSSAQELGSALDMGNGGNVPGQGYGERAATALGLGGALNSPEAQDATQRVQTALIAIRKNNTGTAFSTREAADNALAILGDPSSSPEQRTKAIQHTFDLLQSDIAAKSSARPDDAAEVIGARGMSLPNLGVTANTPKRRPVTKAQSTVGGEDPWAKYRVK